MSAPRIVAAAVLMSAVALTGTAPASATLISPPKYRDAFDDTVCGISSHVVIRASNPVVETGHLAEDGDPLTINTGHLMLRITNVSNGHWMEDDFSGPAKLLSAVVNDDGTMTKRVVFSGIKREFVAWDGVVVADVGRLVVDYVFAGDELLSRTMVSQVGEFPIASGAVDFCDFAAQHLS